MTLLVGEERRAQKAAFGARKEIARAAERVVAALRAGGRLFYVGAGTSGRLGALDAAELPPTFGSSPAQVVAVVAGGPRALHALGRGRRGSRRSRRRCAWHVSASTRATWSAPSPPRA